MNLLDHRLWSEMVKKIGMVRIGLLVVTGAPLVSVAVVCVQFLVRESIAPYIPGGVFANMAGVAYNATWLLLAGNQILGLFKNEEGSQRVSE